MPSSKRDADVAEDILCVFRELPLGLGGEGLSAHWQQKRELQRKGCEPGQREGTAG